MNLPRALLRELPPIDLAKTAVLCTAIAVFLTLVVDTGGSFWSNLLISCGIGYGIHLSMIALTRVTGGRLPRTLIAVAAIGIGVTIGTTLSAAVLVGDPLYFFRQGGAATLVVGLFFGVVGTVIFLSREQVLRMRSELAQAELERLAREKEMTETQLKLLQAQIEPHFLFNTLSNVVGLIDTDPKAAQRMVEHLTTLLRASLKRTRAESTTVGEELAMLRAYLEIHQLRMGARLDYSIDCDETLLERRLPPMLLQPLVENALRHGIAGREGGGRIDVAVERGADGGLLVRVADDGIGLGTTAAGNGAGTGLANVRERLRALYGDAAALRLEENTPQGLVVSLTLPGAQR